MKKQCYICKKWFPATAEFFTRDKIRPDGLHPYCKPCRHTERAKRYKNSPSLMEKARKRANDWFYDNRERAQQSRKEQYQRNREENIRKTAEWREQNPEKYREQNKKLWQRNKVDPDKIEQHRASVRNRRAKLRATKGTHTAENIREIFEYQQGCCFYCGKKLKKFEVDHYYPVSKGGSNSKENLVVACRRCNRSKGDKLPQEFLATLRLHCVHK